MSLSNTSESSLLQLIFENTNWANIGDATGLRGSSTAGSLYIGLHTADPGETGDETTSESAYTNYARVAVARSTAGWTTSGTAPTITANDAAITFAQSGSGPESETYVHIGRASSAAGERLFSGALGATLVVNNLVTPSFAISALSASFD